MEIINLHVKINKGNNLFIYTSNTGVINFQSLLFYPGHPCNSVLSDINMYCTCIYMYVRSSRTLRFNIFTLCLRQQSVRVDNSSISTQELIQ